MHPEPAAQGLGMLRWVPGAGLCLMGNTLADISVPRETAGSLSPLPPVPRRIRGIIAAGSWREEAGRYFPQRLRFSSLLVSESRANRRLLPTARSPARSAECEGAGGAGWGCSWDASGGAAGSYRGSPQRWGSVWLGYQFVCIASYRIFHWLWRWTPWFLIYSLPTLPSSLLLEQPQDHKVPFQAQHLGLQLPPGWPGSMG